MNPFRTSTTLDEETTDQFTGASVSLPTLDQLLRWDEANEQEQLQTAPQPDTSPFADQSTAEWPMAVSSPSEEGQLAVDIFENEGSVFVVSTIAGVRSQDIQIVLQQDLLTIRGARQHPLTNTNAQASVQECYWGPFSRTIILPSAVDPGSVHATLSQGVLTIELVKLTVPESIPIIEVDPEDEQEAMEEEEDEEL